MPDKRTRPDLPPDEAQLAGYDAYDAEADAKAEKRRAEKLQLRKDALTGLIGQAWFREWLWELLGEMGTFEYPIAVTPGFVPDPMGSYFALGKKAAGELLFRAFDDIAPDQTSLMRREATTPRE